MYDMSPNGSVPWSSVIVVCFWSRCKQIFMMNKLFTSVGVHYFFFTTFCFRKGFQEVNGSRSSGENMHKLGIKKQNSFQEREA